MKSISLLSIALIGTLAFSSVALAGGVKTYQVTGPILEVSDSMIAVQKGSDRWELARDASTKAPDDLKVGQKATITYTMTATSVEAKPAAADKAKKAEAKPAASPVASPKKP